MIRTCFSVLALASAIDRDCARRLQAHGLSEGRFVILVVLLKLDGALAPHDLAERIGVTRATMTGLLDGLERDRLVARRRDKRDRRSVKISLTPAGRNLAERLNDAHLRWVAGLASDLTVDEQDVLQRLLARIWQRTDAGSQTAPLAGALEPVHESL